MLLYSVPGALGGVFGVLILAAAAAGIAYFLWRRKKRGEKEKVHPSTTDVRESDKDNPPVENGAPPKDHQVWL